MSGGEAGRRDYYYKLLQIEYLLSTCSLLQALCKVLYLTEFSQQY